MDESIVFLSEKRRESFVSDSADSSVIFVGEKQSTNKICGRIEEEEVDENVEQETNPTQYDGSDPERRRIFVARLPKHLEEKDVVEYFCKYGAVTDVEVGRCPETEAPRGFAHVTFGSVRAVDATMNDRPHKFGIQLLIVKRNIPSDLRRYPEMHIQCGQIRAFLNTGEFSESELSSYFQSFGNITKLFVKSSDEAEIGFDDYDSVDKIVYMYESSVHNIGGNLVHVEKLLSKAQQMEADKKRRNRFNLRNKWQGRRPNKRRVSNLQKSARGDLVDFGGFRARPPLNSVSDSNKPLLRFALGRIKKARRSSAVYPALPLLNKVKQEPVTPRVKKEPQTPANRLIKTRNSTGDGYGSLAPLRY